MMTLTEALLRIPKNFYLATRVEVDPREEGGRAALTACLFEEPPEDGWPTLAAYFGTPGYANDPKRLERYRLDDSVRSGVSVWADDPAAFERLVVGMIEHLWPRKEVQTPPTSPL